VIAWMILGGVGIFPQSQLSINPTNGYQLQSFYYRIPVEISITFLNTLLTTGAWLGREVLGFRPIGSIFYIDQDEHFGGWNLNLRYPADLLGSHWGAQLTYMHELVAPNGVFYIDHTIGGSIFFEL